MGVEQNGTAAVVPDTQVNNPPAETQPFAIPDDAIVEVVVDGQPVRKQWKEARAGIQMHEDYTRKTQGLSTQAKELKELYDGLTAREKAIASKETAIDQILGRAKPGNGQPAQLDPNDVPTVAQIQQMLKEHSDTLTSTLQSKFTETQTQAEQARTFQRWEDLTTTTVESLTKENPILKNIPQLSLVLKREALSDKPQTEQEMIAAVVKAGKGLVAKLDSEFTERQKAIALRKQELNSKGSQPPGGTPSFTPSKKSYGERGKINWDDLEKDVLAAVEASEE